MNFHRLFNKLNQNRHNVLLYQPITKQIRFVHHHKELEEPDGYKRFIGWFRSGRHRANRNTHVNELKYKRLRGRKRLMMELEDDVEKREMEKMSMDQLRMYLLRKGKPFIYKDIGPREWQEHQMTLHTLNDMMDPWIPPETSILSRIKSKEIMGDIKDSAKAKWYSLIGYGERKIRKKEGLQNFDRETFAKEAEKIYTLTFETLANREKQKLFGLVTESAFTKLWPDVEKGTLRWEFVRFNEPSRVTNVRTMELPMKSGNDIAQITVRMHSTQKMALYDKDGHLLVGSEEEPREVLEYVVFENHIASTDGKWRFHGRITPHWLKPKQPINRPSLIEESKEKNKIPSELMKLRFGLHQKLKEKQKEAEEEERNK